MTSSPVQFHNLIIDENLPPSSFSNQPFLRHQKAHPDRDGYGLEMWIMGMDVGTHVSYLSSRRDDDDANHIEDVIECDQIINIDIHEQVLSILEIKNNTNDDDDDVVVVKFSSQDILSNFIIANEDERREDGKSSKVLLIFSCASSSSNKNDENINISKKTKSVRVEFTDCALDFLAQISSTRNNNILLQAIGLFEVPRNEEGLSNLIHVCFDDNQQKKHIPVPVIHRIENGSTINDSSLEKQIFILPLRYGAFSDSVLPVSIVSLLLSKKNETTKRSAKKFVVVKDCTQKFLPQSPCFPGGQIPTQILTDVTNVSRKTGCPFRRFEEEKAEKNDCNSSSLPFSSCSSSASFLLTEDIGTHQDAAKHFYENERGIHQYDGKDLFAPLVIIDISKKVFEENNESNIIKNPDAGVTKNDILEWEEKHGRQIPDGAFVAMRSGFGRLFNKNNNLKNSISYLNGNITDDADALHFPGFELDAIDFLMKERKTNIVGLGVDTLSVDKGIATDFPVHSYFLKQSKFHIENLDLENIFGIDDESNRWWILIAPLRVRDGYEAPCRVLVLKEAEA